MKRITGTAAALAALLTAGGAAAAEEISLQLNWTAGGDHAPVYYAQAQGWYADAGVELEIRQGTGSGAAATALEVGQADMAIIDTPTALQFLAKGAPFTGVFVAYNDNAAGLYWKKSSGISGVQDFAGKKIGAPAFDATRQMWQPAAKALGIDPDTVEWVNLQPTGKVAALQSGAVDVTTHFYSVHFIYEDIFGDDLGYALLRDHGMNTYSLAYYASDRVLAEKQDAVRAVVQVTQRAFAFCLETPEPCTEALSSAVSMKTSDAERQFEYAARVMPGTGQALPVGAWDMDRIASDYGVVQEAYGLPDFDVTARFSNAFIDESVAYPPAD
ncbi:ABC transporter substrate-binding protein [Paralimibaculum aggregatum]|uniref:ABC transporter substrate-binding protein n=1 Tax=Paralimibaculum aggregatum TaxID=3036245 RepID=A0ABQ6LSJ5_9RHOB|nr:ABC transporter substrate-binding protein [Limibaculum sp. NKW23]GMG85046.1 ABC transporter substrate-binding protein [Limibaculum sp. NKW23]